MFGRLHRNQPAWKCFQTIAGLLAVVLSHSACVTSAEPSHTIDRKANTGLAADEGVSVVLDSSSFLSNPRPELRDANPETETPTYNFSYEENLLAGCIFDALEESRPDVHTVPPQRVWKAAYPQLDLEALPRGRTSWPKLTADPDFQRRAARLSVRYLVVARIKETLDDTESYSDGAMHMDSSGAAIGGGYFGSSRTTSLKMNATVYDLASGQPAGSISSTSTGTHDSTIAWAFIIIIPMAVPVFTGDTPSQSATCEELGEAVAQFLNANLDLYLAARSGNLAEAERIIGEGTDVNARGDNGEHALLLAAGNGHSAVAELLIANGADVDARGDDGETALHLATNNGHSAVAELLVANGANVNSTNSRGVTALDAAVAAEHRSIAELLIVNGADDGLHVASAQGYATTVESLLAEGNDANVKDDNNRTPLHHASFAGHTDVANVLIAHGANVNAIGAQDQTPLARAVGAGQLAMAELLIAHGADVESRDRGGHVPLERAVSNGDRKMADLLIENGATVGVLEYHSDRLLDSAARYKHVETAELLLLLGADPNAENGQGNRPLHLAARSGDEGLARLLLDHGAHIEAKNADMDTALRIAVETRNVGMGGLLLARGADVNNPGPDGHSLLNLAVDSGDKSMTELLIANDANVNATDEVGFTPLHRAAQAGNKDIVTLLLASGAEVDARDNRDQSPLVLAVAAGHEDTALELLSSGADATAKNEAGETPLSIASASGRASVAEALLLHGADVNAADGAGRTALHHASGNGHVALAELLITHGAKVEALDTNGNTPVQDASADDHDGVVSLLIAHGADMGAENEVHGTGSESNPLRVAILPMAAAQMTGKTGADDLSAFSHTLIDDTDGLALTYSYYKPELGGHDIGRLDTLWDGGVVEKTPLDPNVYGTAERIPVDIALMFFYKKTTAGWYNNDQYRFKVYLYDINEKTRYEGAGDSHNLKAAIRQTFREYVQATSVPVRID